MATTALLTPQGCQSPSYAASGAEKAPEEKQSHATDQVTRHQPVGFGITADKRFKYFVQIPKVSLAGGLVGFLVLHDYQ